MTGNRYQYDTSPRKIKPEYEQYVKRNTNNKIKKESKENQTKKISKKEEKSKRIKQISKIILMFLILLVVSYRNSQINEKSKEVQDLKSKLSSIEKVNGQLEVSIESSLNLSNIENEATNLLEMQKLNADQKKYVSLPKKDYVETETEEIKIEEDTNWLKKIINKISGN